MTQVSTAFFICCLFTITWGWYKVLLPSVDKAAKIKRADLIHDLARVLLLCSSFGFGILAAFILPEDYNDSGVYSGNFHCCNRAVVMILSCGVLIENVRIGNKIKNQLAAGASKAKVAPEGTAGKKTKELTDADKIGNMVVWVIRIMFISTIYFSYGVAISVGKFRYIERFRPSLFLLYF